MATLNDIVTCIVRWQRETFTQATPSSILAHLEREFKELSEHPDDPSELADIVILILGLADIQGINLEMALVDKHSENLCRRWGKPDAQGVVEHIRD